MSIRGNWTHLRSSYARATFSDFNPNRCATKIQHCACDIEFFLLLLHLLFVFIFAFCSPALQIVWHECCKLWAKTSVNTSSHCLCMLWPIDMHFNGRNGGKNRFWIKFLPSKAQHLCKYSLSKPIIWKWSRWNQRSLKPAIHWVWMQYLSAWHLWYRLALTITQRKCKVHESNQLISLKFSLISVASCALSLSLSVSSSLICCFVFGWVNYWNVGSFISMIR